MNERKRILVIDDDRECIEFVENVLTRKGFDVIAALDGQEGLTKAISDRPDLIILDVVMPEQDGWVTCEKIRSTTEIANVPIIYLTSVDSPKSLFMDHGAFETDWDEYLTKPVTPKSLHTAVMKVLKKSVSVR